MELSEAIEITTVYINDKSPHLAPTDLSALCLVNTAARVLIKLTKEMQASFGDQLLT